jgi:hypothetical protein
VQDRKSNHFFRGLVALGTIAKAMSAMIKTSDAVYGIQDDGRYVTI